MLMCFYCYRSKRYIVLMLYGDFPTNISENKKIREGKEKIVSAAKKGAGGEVHLQQMLQSELFNFVCLTCKLQP